MFSFAMLDLLSSELSQEIQWEDLYLQSDLFCVEHYLKP